jgi:serine/threonine protein kinase
MQLRCPNCNIALDVVGDNPLSDVSCPSCGNALNTFRDGDATAPFSLGTRTSIAHFEILELLGQGTFGLVWKARDTKLHRSVAIKIPRSAQFDPTAFVQFAREAQAAAQVQHPNIVSVYEVGRVDSLVYIVSEYVNGAPLRGQMANRRYQPR